MSDRFEKTLEEFTDYLLFGLGRADGTASTYRNAVRQYSVFFYEDRPEHLEITISQELFERYIMWQRRRIKKSNGKETTLRTYFYGVYRFWKFLFKVGKAPVPIPGEFMEIKFRIVDNPTYPMTEKEFNHLLEDVDDELRRIY